MFQEGWSGLLYQMLLRDQENGDRKVNAGSGQVVINKLEKSSYCEMVRIEANQMGENTGEKNTDKKVARASMDNAL